MSDADAALDAVTTDASNADSGVVIIFDGGEAE
jgi:hypothetical protein